MYILVIEDSQADRELIDEYTEILPGKVKIDYAESFEKAAKKLEKIQYDIVLLDLGLPDSEGLNTVKKYQTIVNIRPKNKETPFVVLTSADSNRTSRDALKMGAKDYLIKGSFAAHELNRTITFATYGQNLKRTKRFWLI